MSYIIKSMRFKGLLDIDYALVDKIILAIKVLCIIITLDILCVI